MADTLGCASTYAVIIYEEIVGNDSDGDAAFGRPVVGIDEFVSINWDRRIDETSQATVRIPMTAECCRRGALGAGIGQLHSWHHGIAIYRDGVAVWDGPIVQIKYTQDYVEITAYDISALLAKRLVPRDICFSDDPNVCVAGATGVSYGARSPEFVAATLIREALSVDGHGAFVDILGESSFTYEAFFYQYGGPIYDLLTKLAQNYINFTVLGRRIVISVGGLTDGTGIAKTATLVCADFKSEGFSVVEDGLAALTEDVQYASDLVVDGVATRNVGIARAFTLPQKANYYYGLLQGIQDGDSVLATAGSTPPLEALTQAAKNIVNGAYPPPLVMSPEGAQLQANAPVTMAQLVPGVLVPIIFDCLCVEIGQTFLLARLDVTFDATGETVTPTFVSLGADNAVDSTL